MFNKKIGYLSCFVDETTQDLEVFLAPLMFSYNTSFHQSVLNRLHFLNYSVKARQPTIMAADVRRKFYGDNMLKEQMPEVSLKPSA